MTKDKPKEESAAPLKTPALGPGLKIGEDGRTYARIRDIDPRHNIRTVENDPSLQELASDTPRGIALRTRPDSRTMSWPFMALALLNTRA